MVSPPRSAKHAAAADAGPACARSTPAHGAPAARPAYWLAQRAAPADLASRPRTAPRAPPAVGQHLLLLLLPSDPHASRRWPTRACQKRDGAHSSESLLSKSNNNPRMHARELSPYHSSPLCHPPTACIALRPAYTRKYTYIFRHIDRSLLAATSRASRPSLPVRMRPRVSLPTLPVDRMQQLWDHMYPDSMYSPATSVYPQNIPISLDA